MNKIFKKILYMSKRAEPRKAAPPSCHRKEKNYTKEKVWYYRYSGNFSGYGLSTDKTAAVLVREHRGTHAVLKQNAQVHLQDVLSKNSFWGGLGFAKGEAAAFKFCRKDCIKIQLRRVFAAAAYCEINRLNSRDCKCSLDGRPNTALPRPRWRKSFSAPLASAQSRSLLSFLRTKCREHAVFFEHEHLAGRSRRAAAKPLPAVLTARKPCSALSASPAKRGTLRFWQNAKAEKSFEFGSEKKPTSALILFAADVNLAVLKFVLMQLFFL